MATRVHILVLNHNGRALLEECLPSVVACARGSLRPCRITVIDNSSTDDSIEFLRRAWPEVAVRCEPNRGLISFNNAIRRIDDSHVVLLNNDVKLAAGCVDQLVQALESEPDCLLAGPQCWGFDGQYEGTHSALCFRRGLVHTRLQPLGNTDECGPTYTASAGAVLAVDRNKFLELGGFDPLFLPGRYEDLDLALRGWLRGWKAVYVPQAVAYHKRSATFAARFSRAGLSRLDVRNSLLFAWKNLREPSHMVRHLYFLILRVLLAVLGGQRFFLPGLASAVRMLPSAMASRAGAGLRVRTERELFELLRYCGGATGLTETP